MENRDDYFVSLTEPWKPEPYSFHKYGKCHSKNCGEPPSTVTHWRQYANYIFMHIYSEPCSVADLSLVAASRADLA